MSRTKKSRTAGNSEEKYTGPRKESSSQAQEARNKKRKSKLKGNKAGARNANESKQTQQKNAKQAVNEKRIGSQKAVPLVIAEKAPAETPKVQHQPKVKVVKSQVEAKISPEKELALIENDDRLNELLEQLDNDEIISQIDQSWVNKQMQRHQEIMKELGWLDEDGEEDLLQQFEDAGSALNEFKK
ncbi:Der GTPase-activating protein YihI [Psychromonas ossibalaenae]|uniref:Der GTPase-activating protein YihI n=1 Tax=Psychromonas ossibalaenae TaxID=444922 RepID=UPI00036E8712|nr:Der GTPase-activating protein YihI [Psychromonas ossibalaenae]